MINSFSFNGKNSSDFGLYISAKDVFSDSASDVVFTPAAGRMGDILTDNKRSENVVVSYDVFTNTRDIIPPAAAAKAVTGWLKSSAEYMVLTDTYDPEYFRYAACVSKLSIEAELRTLLQTSVQFNCKPQKYSFEGQKTITFTSAEKIYNPENMASLPHIRLYGDGNLTLTVNGTAYNFSTVSGHIDADCEKMTASKDGVLQNSKALFLSYPKLTPGWNDISFTGAGKIELIPRWCTK